MLLYLYGALEVRSRALFARGCSVVQRKKIHHNAVNQSGLSIVPGSMHRRRDPKSPLQHIVGDYHVRRAFAREPAAV